MLTKTKEEKYQENLKKVKENPFYLRFIPKDEQTEAICLAAVQQHGFTLKYVQNQTKEICLAAVRQSRRALQFVQEQTKEICLAAVQENGWALEFVPTHFLNEVSKKIGVKLFHCQNRPILVEKINNEYVFTIGCQVRISKERFIQRIHEEDGGLEENPHRQEYLDILEQF